MAWQITRYDSSYADHVSSSCRSSTDIETLPSAWRKLFLDYFGKASQKSLYLVIDGLDEAEDGGEYGRREFLRLLTDLQGMYVARRRTSVKSVAPLVLKEPRSRHSNV
jgi:hypothetical protein